MSEEIKEQHEVKRYDSTVMRIKPKKTPQGFMKAFANVSRTGVFAYRNADGSIRRELRLPEEVFSSKALDTLKTAPITYGHPIEEGSYVLVNPKNVKKFSVGVLGDEIHTDDKFISASLVITDPSVVEAVEKGDRREISLGYNCEVENSSGTWNGQQYDCIQRNIVYNHAAIVKRGRAGSDVSIRMDATDATTIYNDENEIEGKTTMEKTTIKLDGIDFDVNPQVAQAMDKVLSNKQSELASIKEELETTKGQLDATKADLAKAETARMDAEDPAKLNDAIKARVELLTKAKKILGEGAEIDELNERQVKEAVIAKVNPEMKLDSVEDAYVNGSFDHIVSTYKSKAESMAATRSAAEATAKGENDVKKLDPEARRKALLSQYANAWKTVK